ncbi:Hypothetical predicted protein [Olea europaea subsp. europaea]|uniref:Uncharacterized protein n=1 Tax=Olea europaea subsp. europaea TaxID=158383 RepID=A0A8S0UTC5_OLEEU|nr:Hypothetical predicted protein [Olea europaea subsp. europaea]
MVIGHNMVDLPVQAALDAGVSSEQLVSAQGQHDVHVDVPFTQVVGRFKSVRKVHIRDSITRAGNAAYVAGNDNFGAGIASLCAGNNVICAGNAVFFYRSC